MKLKISRLFHWLYATLMFLPLLMFIPSCLYYGFNEHATNETTTQINYKYQSNEVEDLDDLVIGNIYEFKCNELSIDDFINPNGYVLFKLLTELDIERVIVNDYTSSFGKFTPDTYILLSNDTELYISTYFYYEQYIKEDYTMQFTYNDLFLSNCIIQLLKIENYSLISGAISHTDYNVIESVETNVQDTISNKMYLAWEGVWNLPLFQWTKNSFITAPFSYITGLFGLGSDNSLNCVFTYFASISICWLVFDLIMYVPNLAHRWLDRSAIE